MKIIFLIFFLLSIFSCVQSPEVVTEDNKLYKVKSYQGLRFKKKKGVKSRLVPSGHPFVVGERIHLSLSYLGGYVGSMIFETKPMKKINEEDFYHFSAYLKSENLLSFFYDVRAESNTYVNVKTFLPSELNSNIEEPHRTKKNRTVFNWKTMKVRYIQKKIPKEGRFSVKTKKWKLKRGSQNFISAIFYIRRFHLRPNREIKFYVADSGKNSLYKIKVLRRETIKTKQGSIKTILVHPQVSLEGKIKTNKIFIWFTDDKSKYPVKFEAKLKFGTLRGTLNFIEKL